MKDLKRLFDLKGRVAVITGGAGLLGRQHAAALLDLGASVVLLDVMADAASRVAAELAKKTEGRCEAVACDITTEASVRQAAQRILAQFSRVDILINNAADNPKVEDPRSGRAAHLEHFPLEAWHRSIAVGLTGAFLCSRVFGAQMAQEGGGVILNISSDLGLIGPDQRIYRESGLAEDDQFVKPVVYSVVKSGLIGLTRYVATYWAGRGVRCNAICPGGVEAGQPADFVHRLTQLIPMGRMARPDEYQAAIAFLCSDASSYMNGAIVVIDGGRTCW